MQDGMRPPGTHRIADHERDVAAPGTVRARIAAHETRVLERLIAERAESQEPAHELVEVDRQAPPRGRARLRKYRPAGPVSQGRVNREIEPALGQGVAARNGCVPPR